MENKNHNQPEKTPWRWGQWLVSTWASLVFLLLILAFALPRLLGRGWTSPLYGPGEYIEGSYPLFWLVYLWLPLLARDIYLGLVQKRPMEKEVKVCMVLVLVAFSLSYHFIFGWF